MKKKIVCTFPWQRRNRRSDSSYSYFRLRTTSAIAQVDGRYVGSRLCPRNLRMIPARLDKAVRFFHRKLFRLHDRVGFTLLTKHMRQRGTHTTYINLHRMNSATYIT